MIASEEDAVGLIDAMPNLLESALRERGALFVGTASFQPNGARDDRLVTGQNPASVPTVSDLLLEAIREPNWREQPKSTAAFASQLAIEASRHSHLSPSQR
ncbi:MAG: hypothetical protein ROR55_23865 [Devosia sp.]